MFGPGGAWVVAARPGDSGCRSTVKFLLRQFFPDHFVMVNMPEPYLDSVARNRNKAMNNIA